jgi:hypothetical protein
LGGFEAGLEPGAGNADELAMVRRLTVALLVLAAAPSAAAAQAPVDDASAARAFADAALRAQPEIAAASQRLEGLGQQVSCPVRVAKRRRDEVTELKTSLHMAQTIAGFTRAVGPVLTRASNELHGVETTDAALRGGRTGWRRLRRTYAGFAELPKGNVCSQVRAYVRNGYRHTPATRRGMKAFHAMMAWDTADMDRRMQAAVQRMIALGIPAADASAFDGELGD